MRSGLGVVSHSDKIYQIYHMTPTATLYRKGQSGPFNLWIAKLKVDFQPYTKGRVALICTTTQRNGGKDVFEGGSSVRFNAGGTVNLSYIVKTGTSFTAT